jgi:hypothetical protein
MACWPPWTLPSRATPGTELDGVGAELILCTPEQPEKTRAQDARAMAERTRTERAPFRDFETPFYSSIESRESGKSHKTIERSELLLIYHARRNESTK